MGRNRFIASLSFRAKILVAVTLVMTLLVALSLWLVSQQFKRQIQKSADEQLRTAENVLHSRQKSRDSELFLRFSSATNEPKLKAVAAGLQEERALLTSDGQNTMRRLLQDLVTGGMADVMVFAPEPDLAHAIAVARDPRFNVGQFVAKSAGSIEQTFGRLPQGVQTVDCNGRLMDLVTAPVVVSDQVIGTLTFGVSNSLAGDFAALMSQHDDLVLLHNFHVVDSTLLTAAPESLIQDQFTALAARAHAGAMREIVLGDERYWGRAGWLGSADEPNRLGYLILSSSEKPLRELRATQQTILLIGFLAILCGIAVVWFLVQKMTEPLADLQASAEAVGRGDFSRQVEINTRDEFGSLGRAFNQMTRDIEQSQSQLHQTVQTLKTTQAQLIQSEKLSAVGEFVAGVAHELNNPLATVMGFSEMLQRMNPDEKHRRHLELIYKSAQRCQRIVQSLLSFARRQAPERKPVLVNKLIEEVLEVVAYPLRTSNVQVLTQFASPLPLVLADGHQIQQVVLNIINNARQAIEAHQDSGRITITTSSDGRRVRIQIHDNGPGISPENLRRIFDPFFTTKEVGKGTGLGLSLCYGMIHDHGGSISAESQLGNGATFTIELPVAVGGGAEAIAVTGALPSSTSLEGNGRKILAVDDEEPLLALIKEELTNHNYKVVTVTNGEAALQTLRGEKFDLVVCDLKMPGLNGRQVYERLRDDLPDYCQRMVFVTGDLISDPLRNFLESEKRPCLAKPFSLGELRQVVRTELAKS
jgi:signal transduction histidine kinase